MQSHAINIHLEEMAFHNCHQASGITKELIQVRKIYASSLGECEMECY